MEAFFSVHSLLEKNLLLNSILCFCYNKYLFNKQFVFLKWNEQEIKKKKRVNLCKVFSELFTAANLACSKDFYTKITSSI